MSNFQITRGDTRKLDATVTEGKGGPAVNLTGVTLRFTARTSPEEATAVITKVTGTGIAHTDVAAGKARITIDPADTTGLPNTGDHTLHYDLQITTAAGEVYTLIRGLLFITQEVT